MSDEITLNQVKRVPNPTGKGGFVDHPEHIGNGRWSKENSFSYWLNYFKSITIPEFKAYKDTHPDMTMSALAAYARAGKMIEDLGEFQVVANRTEGMPKQTMGFDDDVHEVKITIKTNGTGSANNEDIPG